MRWPASADLSQLFGENGHSGIDIMAGFGDPVVAARDGVVTVIADSDFGYGKRIEIDHGGGMSTLYGHLSQFSVVSGQRVTAGQRIGSAGDTGYSFGPHLHFEVRLSGVPVDPLAYLP
jgi:murein DD-endopeptidase MepM/ murein hydrolase activator NlpD